MQEVLQALFFDSFQPCRNFYPSRRQLLCKTSLRCSDSADQYIYDSELLRFRIYYLSCDSSDPRSACCYQGFFVPSEVMPLKLRICSRRRAPLRPVRDCWGRPLQASWTLSTLLAGSFCLRWWFGRKLKEGTYYYSDMNLCFLIPSCLILVSNVDRGIPSFAAAPSGPATFPLHSANAVSIISLS